MNESHLETEHEGFDDASKFTEYNSVGPTIELISNEGQFEYEQPHPDFMHYKSQRTHGSNSISEDSRVETSMAHSETTTKSSFIKTFFFKSKEYDPHMLAAMEEIRLKKEEASARRAELKAIERAEKKKTKEEQKLLRKEQDAIRRLERKRLEQERKLEREKLAHEAKLEKDQFAHQRRLDQQLEKQNVKLAAEKELIHIRDRKELEKEMVKAHEKVLKIAEKDDKKRLDAERDFLDHQRKLNRERLEKVTEIEHARREADSIGLAARQRRDEDSRRAVKLEQSQYRRDLRDELKDKKLNRKEAEKLMKEELKHMKVDVKERQKLFKIEKERAQIAAFKTVDGRDLIEGEVTYSPASRF